MSLRQGFADGIEEIFTEMDDLVYCATYIRSISSAYISGGQVSEQSITFQVRFLEDTSTERINGVDVSNFDKVFLIPAVDLCDIPPSINDKIKTSDGVSYTVNQHSTDPSTTSYMVGVKK